MDIFEIREAFTKAGIMICFNGPFSHSIIDEIGMAVRNHLSADNLSKAAVLDVFAVYIELAQNVKNYLSQRNLNGEAGSASIITIAKRDGMYIVTSGNNVLKQDAPALQRVVDTVNGLDGPELKKRYREQLRKERQPEAMGAGLGLMEIAKRSTRQMTYTLCDIDETYSFFSLRAYV